MARSSRILANVIGDDVLAIASIIRIFAPIAAPSYDNIQMVFVPSDSPRFEFHDVILHQISRSQRHQNKRDPSPSPHRNGHFHPVHDQGDTHHHAGNPHRGFHTHALFHTRGIRRWLAPSFGQQGKALFSETSGLAHSARSAMGWEFCPAARPRTNPRLHRRQRWEPLPRSERSHEK